MFEKVEVDINGVIEFIYAYKISENIYRCEESSVIDESIVCGCEIEARKDGEKLKYVKLNRRSRFKTFRFLWSRELIESEKGKK